MIDPGLWYCTAYKDNKVVGVIAFDRCIGNTCLSTLSLPSPQWPVKQVEILNYRESGIRSSPRRMAKPIRWQRLLQVRSQKWNHQHQRSHPVLPRRFARVKRICHTGALWCVLLWWLPVGCLSNQSAAAEPVARRKLQGTFVSITVYAEQLGPTAIAAFSEFRASIACSASTTDSDLQSQPRHAGRTQAGVEKAWLWPAKPKGLRPTIRPWPSFGASSKRRDKAANRD